METLNAQSIQLTQLEMRQLDGSDLEKLGRNFLQQQPDLYAYLVLKGDNARYNQDEKEFLLYQGMLLWQLLTKAFPGQPRLRRIPALELEEGDLLNQMLFTDITPLPWVDAQIRIREQINIHVQPEVYRHLLDTVNEDPNGAELQDKNKTGLIMTLLTALDALSEQ